MPPLDQGSPAPPLLDIADLEVRIDGAGSTVWPVRGASLSVRHGETLALIGESGSGKSMLGLAIVRLLPERARATGTILFDGNDLLARNSEEMAAIRGRGIAFVPQSAGLALNPCMRAQAQVAEVFRRTRGLTRSQARTEAHALLYHLDLDARARNAHPHQLSGGMRQRLLIAIGLACQPRLLIVDEPTKGIDSQLIGDVVACFRRVRADNPDIAMAVVTHDLRFAAEIADRVVVMYAGHVVEDAPASAFFAGPKHPYARGLLAATPESGLTPIPGMPPSMTEILPGCPFSARCSEATSRCRAAPPPRLCVGDTLVACYQYD